MDQAELPSRGAAQGVRQAVLLLLVRQGQMWTTQVVEELKEDGLFYPQVYAALRHLEAIGKVVRVPGASVGARGPVLWRPVNAGAVDLDREWKELADG